MATIFQGSKPVRTGYTPFTIHRGERAMKKMQALLLGVVLVIGLLTGSEAMAQETAVSDREFVEALVAFFGGGGGPLEVSIRQDDGVQAINICHRAGCLCSGSFCAELIAAGFCKDLKYPTAGGGPPNLCLCEFP